MLQDGSGLLVFTAVWYSAILTTDENVLLLPLVCRYAAEFSPHCTFLISSIFPPVAVFSRALELQEAE